MEPCEFRLLTRSFLGTSVADTFAHLFGLIWEFMEDIECSEAEIHVLGPDGKKEWKWD